MLGRDVRRALIFISLTIFSWLVLAEIDRVFEWNMQPWMIIGFGLAAGAIAVGLGVRVGPKGVEVEGRG